MLGDPGYLWVDAICIEQSDEQEKSDIAMDMITNLIWPAEVKAGDDLASDYVVRPRYAFGPLHRRGSLSALQRYTLGLSFVGHGASRWFDMLLYSELIARRQGTTGGICGSSVGGTLR
jgi:hypothetical protein